MSHAMYDSPCMTVCSILMFQSFGIIKLLFLTKLNILFQSGDSDDPFGGNQFGESGFVSSNQEQTFEQPFDQSGFDQPFDQSDAFPAAAQPGPIATQNSVVSVEIPWGDDPFATNTAPAAPAQTSSDPWPASDSQAAAPWPESNATSAPASDPWPAFGNDQTADPFQAAADPFRLVSST